MNACHRLLPILLILNSGVVLAAADSGSKSKQLHQSKVIAEIQTATDIIAQCNFSAALNNPFIVSSLYYHKGFLSKFSPASPNQHPSRQIIAAVKRKLTPEFADSFLKYLSGFAPQEIYTRWNKPVTGKKVLIGGGHVDAIDIFVREGSPVLAMASGVVVLAERDWDAENPFSSSSPRGGNAVILYNPSTQRFIRYCHLSQVTVNVRQKVDAGNSIGTVGHSGTNASRGGHGGHVHIEMNQWEAKTHQTIAVPSRQLAALAQ